MKVLIACEESQTLTELFRAKGIECYSCDLKPAKINPDWHLQGDVFGFIGMGWDLMIAHPPCTYLTLAANKWLKDQEPRKSGALVGSERRQAQKEAADFFIRLYNSKVARVVIENPIGVMSSIFRKPDQTIQPYFFGEPHSKATCLWLKNMPKLFYSKKDTLFDKGTLVEPEMVEFKSGKRMPKWYVDASKYDAYIRSEIRSKTFPGIANAMVNQWAEFLLSKSANQ